MRSYSLLRKKNNQLQSNQLISRLIIIILFSFIIIQIQSQNRNCYVICKQNNCSPINPLICTGCQPGLVNIQNSCVGSYRQPEPLREFYPLQSNQLKGTQSPAVCSVSSLEGSSTMAFQEISGRTIRFTKDIDAKHDFVQIKFNALVFSPNVTVGILNYKISSQNSLQNGNDYIVNKNQTIKRPPSSDITFRCQLKGSNGNQTSASYPFFIVQKFQQTSNKIDLEISLQQTTSQVSFGVANILFYYGVCSSRCSTCQGPTENQCIICRGLYLDNNNKTCSRCPGGFYDSSNFCRSCPPQFDQCQLQSAIQNSNIGLLGNTIGISRNVIRKQNKASNITGCDTKISGVNASSTECTLQNQYFTELTQPNFDLNQAQGWTSSQRSQNPITQCGLYSLVGGFLLGRAGATVSKTFNNLLAHETIWLKFTIFLIDQIQNGRYALRIIINQDSQSQQIFNQQIDISYSSQQSFTFTNQCGQKQIQFATRVTIRNIIHTAQSIKITIQGFASYFGIRDFTLGVDNQTFIQNCKFASVLHKCIQCKFGYSVNPNTGLCQSCPQGNYQATAISILSNPILINLNNSKEFSSKFCKICPIQCKTCVQSQTMLKVHCTSCELPLTLQNDRCIDLSNKIYSQQSIATNLLQQIRKKNSVTLIQKLGLLRASLVELNPKIKNLLTQQKEWSFYPKLPTKGYTICNNQSIIGSTIIQYRTLQMTRTFKNLPAHQGISIHFHFYQIDDFSPFNSQTNKSNVYFMLDGVRTNYIPVNQKRALCGNQTGDAIKKIYLSLPSHQGPTLTLSIISDSMVKFGVNDLILYLNGCLDQICKNGIDYKIQSMPIYSVQTPPRKGMLVKYILQNSVQNFTDFRNVFTTSLVRRDANSLNNIDFIIDSAKQKDLILKGRVLQQASSSNFSILQDQLRAQKQYRQLLNLSQSYLDHNLQVVVQNPQNIQKLEQNRNIPLRDIPKTSRFPRYDDIGQQDTGYRTNARNFRNFFRGCAVFGMFVGLVSFFFGLSSSFDDFFTLTQVIFVHVFINSLYNPFTIKVPLQGFSIVQFMAWLPYSAKLQIQKGILPGNLYQYSPIVYQQYYQDIVFARTIYHTVLFLAAMVIFYIILTIISAWFDPTKLDKNYFRQYYYEQQDKMLVFLDKVVRFSFFTVMWASILQFLQFQNKPLQFNIWNGVLNVFIFVVYTVYPIILTFYLFRKTRNVTEQTYNTSYQNLRIGYKHFLYVLVRYYYWLAIAAIIAPQWNSNPLGVLLPLIIIHIAHGLVIIFTKPFGMVQPDRLNVCFYNYYPTAYWLMSAIQNFLFVILQILLIAQYATRNFASQLAYLSLGWGFNIIVCLLLANGLIRILFGLMKQIQGCHTGRRDLQLIKDRQKANIDNVITQQQRNQEKIPIKSSRIATQRNLLSALQNSRNRRTSIMGINNQSHLGNSLANSRKRPSIAQFV